MRYFICVSILVIALMAACSDDETTPATPNVDHFDKVKPGVVDIPDSLSNSSSAVQSRFNQDAATGAYDDALDFFRPVEDYIGVVDEMAAIASELITSIKMVAEKYPAILETGTYPINDGTISSVDVTRLSNNSWKYHVNYAKDGTEKTGMYLQFTVDSDHATGTMTLSADFYEPDTYSEGEYISIEFDTDTEDGAWMEVRYVYPKYTDIQADHPTKLIIEVVESENLYTVTGGTYHPAADLDNLGSMEKVYSFRGVSENNESGENNALLEVGLVDPTHTDTSTIMTENSLADIWESIACSYVKEDTEIMTALSVDNTTECDEVITALANYYETDPTHADLTYLFTILQVTNPLYIEANEPTQTSGSIEFTDATEPAGFDNLKQALALVELITPASIKALSLEDTITAEGM